MSRFYVSTSSHYLRTNRILYNMEYMYRIKVTSIIFLCTILHYFFNSFIQWYTYSCDIMIYFPALHFTFLQYDMLNEEEKEEVNKKKKNGNEQWTKLMFSTFRKFPQFIILPCCAVIWKCLQIFLECCLYSFIFCFRCRLLLLF